ncbi:MAG: tail fiber domain-containing protein [Bacteroidota bacterium]
MKRKLFLRVLSAIVLMILQTGVLSAQSTGFSYQAVARDAQGNILRGMNLVIHISIHTGTPEGELVWQETQFVTTNDLGLFNMVICDAAATPTGGTYGSAGDIPWGTDRFYMGMIVEEGDQAFDMGSTELHAVPYALAAREDQQLTFTGTTLSISEGNSVSLSDLVNDADASPTNEIQDLIFVNGILSLSNDPTPTSVNLASEVASSIGWARKADTIATMYNVGVGTSRPDNAMLAVQGIDPLTPEPLFEVRNSSGQPLFSVYNDGVWVYVDDGAKGTKSGFAVGGYNSATKGPGQEFLRVTKDSTRVYFNEAAKGPKGGFAVGGYNSGKGSSQLMSLELTNYLIGHSAGISLTGLHNQFFGYQAGMSSTSANYNVYMGYQAGSGNTGGDQNVTIGYQAGMTGTGYNNVLLGYKAGYSGSGYNNVIQGYQAGYRYNGNNSVIIGDNAGYNAVEGWSNVFIGNKAGYNNNGSSGSAGARNVFIGREAGYANTTGGDNAYIGTFAGADNESGLQNVVIGIEANSVNTAGSYNVYLGNRAGYTNSGNSNVVLGDDAGSASSNYTIASSYASSTFLGAQAGYSATTGTNNTFVGYRAGRAVTTGSGNVFIGYSAGSAASSSSTNKFYLANNSSTYLMYGDFSYPGLRIEGNVGINYPYVSGYGLIVDTPSDQTEVYALYVIGSSYTSSGTWSGSDKNLKTNIRPLDDPLGKLEQLSGVSFDWDQSKAGQGSEKSSIGVLAQDVEKVFPELVKDGPEGYKAVNYDGLIPVLIEAVKQQQAEKMALQQELDAQKALIEELRRRIEALEE